MFQVLFFLAYYKNDFSENITLATIKLCFQIVQLRYTYIYGQKNLIKHFHCLFVYSLYTTLTKLKFKKISLLTI